MITRVRRAAAHKAVQKSLPHMRKVVLCPLHCIDGLFDGEDQGELARPVHVIRGDVVDFRVPVGTGPPQTDLAMRRQLPVHPTRRPCSELLVFLAGSRPARDLADQPLHFVLRTFLRCGHNFRPSGKKMPSTSEASDDSGGHRGEHKLEPGEPAYGGGVEWLTAAADCE